MLPLYLEKHNPNSLKERAEKLLKLQKKCRLCPNECLSNRSEGKTGLCNSTNQIMTSSFGPHFGEESPLVGFYGSGTIFFTNCNLSCIYCQNYDISHLGYGKKNTVENLAQTMINLQNRGCHNINFVTPTHFTPQIIEALIKAIDKGLEIPLVYNCGGYESIETLKLLDGVIDIYMPDIKYSENKIAEKYSGIKSYWNVVKNAVKEMHDQVGDLKVNRKGIAQRGLLIRHLILPNNLAGSRKVIDFIAENISQESYINLMDQYHPAYNACHYKELNRRITNSEYSEIINYAISKGFKIYN
ncbi:MAG: radical SAM protein [Ignavibacteria bacterium]|jgi:putative pyruvate formate lyase activating enzyme